MSCQPGVQWTVLVRLESTDVAGFPPRSTTGPMRRYDSTTLVETSGRYSRPLHPQASIIVRINLLAYMLGLRSSGSRPETVAGLCASAPFSIWKRPSLLSSVLRCSPPLDTGLQPCSQL